MKKILTLVLGASLLAGAAMGVVNAQGAASGPFADVPTDHWAYSSVEKLRDAGIVIGYPDGTYGGHRPMTRYEFAEAIARLLPLIGKTGGGLGGFDATNYYTKTDVDGLLAGKASQAALDQLRADLTAKLQANQDALDNLTKLVNQFQPELQQLGVDVASVKAQLKGISDRLAVVEAEQARVHITGDVNVIARSDYNYRGNGTTPEDQNGYRIGNPGGKNDILAQPEVYNDILLNIVGRVSDNAQAVVRMDIGSYANYLGSETGMAPGRVTYGLARPETYNLYEAYLQSPVSLGALTGASVTAGRFGEQFTDITYKAVNPDVYTNLEQTNSGNVIGDGLSFRFGAGPVKFNAFATKTALANSPYTLLGAPGVAFPTTSGTHRPGSGLLNPGGATYAGAFDQTAGVRAVWGGPNNMTVGLTGVVARTAVTTVDPWDHKAINTVSVYGADIQGSLPFEKTAGVTYKVEGAVSPTGSSSSLGNVNSTKGNEAYKGELGYTAGALNVGVSGQAIYTNFCAPGYWDHFGTWTNPTNIAGGGINAGYVINPMIKVYAAGDTFQGLDTTKLSPIESTKDKLNHLNVGAKFTLNSGYTADLGYEWVEYQIKDGNKAGSGSPLNGNPYEAYYNIGIGHSINPNATVKVLYQIVDYHDQNTHFDTQGNNSGGVALTQLDVKF